MGTSPEILENLINSFAKLPGIGKKTARRLAYYMINSERKTADNFISALSEAKSRLRLCPVCYNLTGDEICSVCADEKRNGDVVCVVESFSDLYLFEKLGVHKGTYHVLGGLISPLDGINPSSLKLSELFLRIDRDEIKELIIGLNQSVEGDTTALYIAEKLKRKDIKITRLATGIPVGGEIGYTDSSTLRQAYNDRKQLGD
jgi:recombination protein RecR